MMRDTQARAATPEDALRPVLEEVYGRSVIDTDEVYMDVPYRLCEALRAAGYVIKWPPPERRFPDD